MDQYAAFSSNQPTNPPFLLSSAHPLSCPQPALANVINAPARCTYSKLEQTKRTGGGWRVQVCWKSFSIFDPPLPRIQAPVTRATAPVSRHAMPWTNLQDWVWTRIVRCRGENFQWEKYGAGVEEGATGSSSRGVSLGKLPFYMFSVLTALEIRHLAERVKFIQGNHLQFLLRIQLSWCAKKPAMLNLSLMNSLVWIAKCKLKDSWWKWN